MNYRNSWPDCGSRDQSQGGSITRWEENTHWQLEGGSPTIARTCHERLLEQMPGRSHDASTGIEKP